MMIEICGSVSGAPLLLYMQNQSLQASALFSDATIDVLLADGCKLIGEALERLGVTTVDSPRPAAHVQHTQAYLVQSPDSPVRYLLSWGSLSIFPTIP